VKHLILTAATALALVASAVSAQAGCADPRTLQGAHVKSPAVHLPAHTQAHISNDAAKAIVGTWYVVYTVEGNPFANAYIQWHDDGTEWENIDFSAASGNICMGEWGAAGKKTFSRDHVGWLYNDGTLTGYFIETETDKLAKDGNSYAGTNEQKVYDLDGNLLADVTGTSSATRFGS
jgi:hypothetical protein